MTTRVLIVDDHRIMREGLRLVLSRYPDIMVVGDAVDGHDTFAKVERLHPDIVLLDVFMPVMDGIAVTKRLRAQFPEVRIVVLTMDTNPEDVRQLLEAGIDGFVLKEAPATEVVQAIRAAADGDAMLDASAVRTLLMEYRRIQRSTRVPRDFDLTGRETEILCRLTYGESNKEIARALGLAEKTVRNHLHSIFNKIGVTDRTQAALLAVRSGLCDDAVTARGASPRSLS